MEESILTATKKALGLVEGYTVFDLDILTHINATFSTLTQLGIGPSTGIFIEDASSEWSEFFPDTDRPVQNMVKTYVYLKVRMLFDTPGTSFLIGAYENQIKELEWRLSEAREQTIPFVPTPDPIV